MNDSDSDSESVSKSYSGTSESVNEDADDDLLRDTLETLNGSRHNAAPFVPNKKEVPNAASGCTSSTATGSFPIDKTGSAAAEKKEPEAVAAEKMESTPSSAIPLLSNGSHDEDEGDNETETANKSEQDGVEEKLESAIFQPLERNVRLAKWAVVAALAVCSLMVCVSVYSFAETSDINTFKEEVSSIASTAIAKSSIGPHNFFPTLLLCLQYENYVTNIQDLVKWKVQQNFVYMEQFSAEMTTVGLLTGAKFPFLTLPQFEVLGGYVIGMSGLNHFSYAPLVKDRSAWEEYAIANQGWLQESARLKIDHPSHLDPMHGTIQDNEERRRLDEEGSISPISDVIYRFDNGLKMPDASSPGGVYAPLWQITPAVSSAVNVNLLSDAHVSSLFHDMLLTNHSILAAPIHLGDFWRSSSDDSEELAKEKSDPYGYFMAPVYSEFAKNASLVGILLAAADIDSLLYNVVPEGVSGIVCVIIDTCGSAVSYSLNGINDHAFLGEADFHDPKFEAYRRDIRIEQTQTAGCLHDLHIFPTQEFKNSYKTKKPIVYTSIVAMSFVITAVVLILYELMVSRRQKATLSSAIRTNAIVASLFPANVRDRLMDEAQRPKNDGIGNYFGEEGQENAKQSQIADFFPDTTIMFADIKGFTAWSSSREPYQVFLLLETIYGAFDAIAKRRQVFKVETVGDCYVAAAGVPHCRKDHAIVMARFACDCRSKVQQLIPELQATLGPGTEELMFRIGLHSGPITGGVIRGQNARFQLFGDTSECQMIPCFHVPCYFALTVLTLLSQ
jgi:class 3 adenylate cyclase